MQHHVRQVNPNLDTVCARRIAQIEPIDRGDDLGRHTILSKVDRRSCGGGGCGGRSDGLVIHLLVLESAAATPASPAAHPPRRTEAATAARRGCVRARLVAPTRQLLRLQQLPHQAHH